MPNNALPLSYDSTVYRFDAKDLEWPGDSWQRFTEKISKTFGHVTKGPNNTAPTTIWIRTAKRHGYVTELLNAARNNAIKECEEKARTPEIELAERTFRIRFTPETFGSMSEWDQFFSDLNNLAGVSDVAIHDLENLFLVTVDDADFDPALIRNLLEQACREDHPAPQNVLPLNDGT